MLPLTVWMNMPSFYQDDLFNSLAQSPEIDLRVIFAHDLSTERAQLGWQLGQKHYPCHLLNARHPVRDAMRQALRDRQRVHMMNGIWAEPSFMAALSLLRLAGASYAIYSEAPDPTVKRSGPKERAKKVFGRWIGRGAVGLLAASHFAADFYQPLGVKPNYPFGYFRASYGNASEHPKPDSSIHLVYVGQLVPRKGVDLLLAALEPVCRDHPDVILSIIGDGEERETLRSQAKTMGEQVRFLGVLPADQVRDTIAAADLLVLPSRHDGWGIVVNEAFSVGIPVIVSDACGAADLVQSGANGYIFRSDDVQSLRTCLNTFLTDQPRWSALRESARQTGQLIAAERAAPYLVACLKHMTGRQTDRPVPPWLIGNNP